MTLARQGQQLLLGRHMPEPDRFPASPAYGQAPAVGGEGDASGALHRALQDSRPGHGCRIVKRDDAAPATDGDPTSIGRDAQAGDAAAFVEAHRWLFRSGEIPEHHLLAVRTQERRHQLASGVRKPHLRPARP